jgi:hypothetical protein
VDCTGTPVPKASRTLEVTVSVDYRSAVTKYLMELWKVVWKDGVIPLAVGIMGITVGLILFLYRRVLKKSFDYGDEEKEEDA